MALSLKMIVSLQDHDQSVDPNLVKLADAYDIASAKLKEASQHEEGAAPPAHPSSQSGECMQAYCAIEQLQPSNNAAEAPSVLSMSSLFRECTSHAYMH